MLRDLVRATLFLLALTQSACATLGGHLSGELSGAVIDKATGEPIEGAIVVVRWEGDGFHPVDSRTVCFHVESATTGQDGKFTITAFPPTPVAVMNTRAYVAGVYKEGYREVLYGDRQQPGYISASIGTVQLIATTGNIIDNMHNYSVERRLDYLSKWVGLISCSGAGEQDKGALPAYLAVYNEARKIAKTAHDRKRMQSFCNNIAEISVPMKKNSTTQEQDAQVYEYLLQKYPGCLAPIDDSREKRFRGAIVGRLESTRVQVPGVFGRARSSEGVTRQTEQKIKEHFIQAASPTDIEVIHEMLRSGFSPNTAYSEGRTKIKVPIISVAIWHGNTEAVNLLLNYGANPEELDSKDNQPLFHAAFSTNIDDAVALSIIDTLKLAGAAMDRTIYPQRTKCPLIAQAVARNHVAAVRRLIASGAEVNVTCLGSSLEKGNTALHLAFRETSDQDGLFMAKQLVAAGADINTKGRSGASPLMMAAWSGNASAVEFLLESGADISASDNFGQTALMYAVKNAYTQGTGIVLVDVNLSDPIKHQQYPESPTQKGRETYARDRVKLVRLLLDKGADRSSKDSNGRTAMDLAKNSPIKVAQEIIEALEHFQ